MGCYHCSHCLVFVLDSLPLLTFTRFPQENTNQTNNNSLLFSTLTSFQLQPDNIMTTSILVKNDKTRKKRKKSTTFAETASFKEFEKDDPTEQIQFASTMSTVVNGSVMDQSSNDHNMSTSSMANDDLITQSNSTTNSNMDLTDLYDDDSYDDMNQIQSIAQLLQQDDDKDGVDDEMEYQYGDNHNHPHQDSNNMNMNLGSELDLGNLIHSENDSDITMPTLPKICDDSLNDEQDNDNNMELSGLETEMLQNSTLNQNQNLSKTNSLSSSTVNISSISSNNNQTNSMCLISPTIVPILENDILLEPDSDHTLNIQLPANLMETPQIGNNRKNHNRYKGSKSWNSYLQDRRNYLPKSPFEHIDNLLQEVNDTVSNLNDSITSELGKSTNAFRVGINQCYDISPNQSLNTQIHTVERVLHDQYQHIQQNETLNFKSFNSVNHNYNQQQRHSFHFDDDDEIINQDHQGNYDNNQCIEQQNMDCDQKDWRDIAEEFGWFPSDVANNPLPYERPKSSASNMDTDHYEDQLREDPQSVIKDQLFLKLEKNEANKLSAELQHDIQSMVEMIKDLESEIDGNYQNNPLIKKIKNAKDAQEIEEIMNKCHKLRELCEIKTEKKFYAKKLEHKKEKDNEFEEYNDKLIADLENLRKVDQNLNNECFEEQQRIHSLQTFETNQHKLRDVIIQNDKFICTQQRTNQLYQKLLNEAKFEQQQLNHSIEMETQRLVELNDDIDRSFQYKQEIEEVASTITWLKGITGIQINKITHSEIQLIIMKWISFAMDYNYQTQNVCNIKWSIHPSPKLKDSFSEYLLNMVYSIGDKLNVTSIKTLSDLKLIAWDIVELLKGIVELRVNINIIANTVDDRYKIVIKPLKMKNGKNNELNLQLSISGDIDYADIDALGKPRMRSQLLVDCIMTLRLGFPNNKLIPKICIILNRQILSNDKSRYETCSERVDSMLIENKLNEYFEKRLVSKVEVGPNLLLRFANFMVNEMDQILKNEARYKHSYYTYSDYK